jgi:uncharacterized membrane protein
MQPSTMHYFPHTWPFLLGLFLALVIVLALVEFRVLRWAYGRMGLSPRTVLAILLLTFLGSYINIPIAEFPGEKVVSDQVVVVNGVPYVVPTVHREHGTILAVNVGGALIPTLLSLYLMVKNRLYLQGSLAVLIVAVVVHWLATPVKGVGITVPTFTPPLVAVAVAMILGWRQAPALAYIGGSLGALIGADLSNLDKVQGLGAPVASIGGAGTFDGVFLTGILAVLLAPGGQALQEPERKERPLPGHDPLRL